MRRFAPICMGLSLLSAGCGDVFVPPGANFEYTEKREPCADRNAFRNLYFGDLHAHTGLSFDAWAYGNHATPDQAYLFARGEDSMELAAADGNEARVAAMKRPLDFVALSDHSEFLGELNLCLTEGSPVYDEPICAEYRQGDMGNVVKFGSQLAMEEPERLPGICDTGKADCLEAARKVWAGVVASADKAYDRTAACRFTAFAGYEYTNSTNVTNLHRNVIFRNDSVPDLPITYFEQPSPWGLLEDLDSKCVEAGTGCDVISIPHNSNWSNGMLFRLDYDGNDDPATQKRMAELRARMEPIVEIFQHKGDMECDSTLEGLGGEPDHLCDWEKQRFQPFDQCMGEPGFGGVSRLGCVSRLDFVRNVLKAGIGEEVRIGANPYRLGIIGSTDTHNATPGFVDETDFKGHVGTTDDTAIKRLGPGNMTHHGVVYNPGGLAAVWAVENSRDAIFEAMRRREVYGTSGPRIEVRMFGGWDLPADSCERDDLVKTGYRLGVPMGGVLPTRGPDAASPVMVVRAVADITSL
ncbi:MAG: DUF3604 domain-containing protein, partial [Deltaproteobacteria bacterium]|nr:DUF3604 domain-containing protein [Deltaproteobacteria bacterium]